MPCQNINCLVEINCRAYSIYFGNRKWFLLSVYYSLQVSAMSRTILSNCMRRARSISTTIVSAAPMRFKYGIEIDTILATLSLFIHFVYIFIVIILEYFEKFFDYVNILSQIITKFYNNSGKGYYFMVTNRLFLPQPSHLVLIRSTGCLITLMTSTIRSPAPFLNRKHYGVLYRRPVAEGLGMLVVWSIKCSVLCYIVLVHHFDSVMIICLICRDF